MKKNTVFAVLILISFITITTFSGCLEYFDLDDSGIIYEAHPTKIRYNIRYGYRINCSGSGEYEIKYNCDKPELLMGNVSSNIIYYRDYEEVTLANNSMISWSISGTSDYSYELGINADVEAVSFLVSDLNGANALTVPEINTLHSDLISQYCNEQSVNDTTYIDPDDPAIKSIIYSLQNQEQDNNSFILAKKLFIWLKENTNYQIHDDDGSVQPARITCLLKTGDCDDLSFLYISLCRSINIPSRFIRGILVEETNGVVSAVPHAWVEVFVGGDIGDDGWIPVECAGDADKVETEVNQNFGVENVDHLRLFRDNGSNESLNMSISGPIIQYESGVDIDMTPFVEIDNYIMLDSRELLIDKNGNRAYK